MSVIGLVEYTSGSKFSVEIEDGRIELRVTRPGAGRFVMQMRPDQARRIGVMLDKAATKLEALNR